MLATWTRRRLTALRQRASGIVAQAATNVTNATVPTGSVRPPEVGGPVVTALDIQVAGKGVEEILIAYRAGRATQAQLRAIGAVNDSTVEARGQLDAGVSSASNTIEASNTTGAAYGAGVDQGYQAGDGTAAARYAGDYPEPEYPEPNFGPEV